MLWARAASLVGARVPHQVRSDLSTQQIHTCSTSLLNSGAPNTFLICVKHHHHYRKKHHGSAGDQCPVLTSDAKSALDMDFFKLSLHRVTKMTICISNGSHHLCKILCVLHTMLFLPPNSQHGRVYPAWALETWDSHNKPFRRQTALRTACLAEKALCRGTACWSVLRRNNIITLIRSLGRWRDNMTYCRTQIQKHSLVQTVNFLENNEATRLKSEQSHKVKEWDSCPPTDPKGPFSFF